MRLDFLGIGFGRSGSRWLANCLYEHPEISMPKFCLLTEINYFPEEYEIMGLQNYIKKFKNCNFEKVVGEISTLIINKERSAKLIKKLFPNTKIIIYKRDDKKRAESLYKRTKYYDLLPAKLEFYNQEKMIKPWIKEYGKENIFIMDMENENKQEELNKLFKFIGVKEFTPPSLNKKINTGYTNDKRTNYRQSKYHLIRKIINFIKPKFRKNKKLYYYVKRNWHMDFYFQWINNRL